MCSAADDPTMYDAPASSEPDCFSRHQEEIDAFLEFSNLVESTLVMMLDEGLITTSNSDARTTEEMG